MPRRRQRLYFGIFSMLLIGFAAYLVLNALDENLQFFKTPTEVVAKPEFAKTMRLGGYVKEGSLISKGTKYSFLVTDFENDVEVSYEGLLPSLFREGQGVVAIGKLGQNLVFVADKILAKHDEKYMPPEIADKLKAQENGYPKLKR